MSLPLTEVLAYKHPAVVARFQKEHPHKAHEAALIFEDLMRFFWASKNHEIALAENPNDESLQFVFIMEDEMKDIDLIWHVFLLYTQDYMGFCDTYFGEYLHHLPDIVPNQLTESFDTILNLERFLSNVYDSLGEDVVRRWFAPAAA